MLLRYDHMVPDYRSIDQSRARTIVGVAYWFRETGSVTTSLMLDYDGQTFSNFTTFQPAQKKIAIHALVNF
jgi:hypothetical protein